MGFPTRSNRTAFGPTREDYKPITDSVRQNSAADYNLLYWQTAGLSQVCPRVYIRCSVAGGAVTVEAQQLAWDANGAISPITFTYVAAGAYTWTFASTYNNELGVATNLVLDGGILLPTRAQASKWNGSHTGANNVPVLVDSTQSWTVNELVGKQLFNVTDGSSTIVTANTADTVTGVLAGGTDDDWDTGDVYIILELAYEGALQLNTDYGGFAAFRNISGVLADPGGFIMLLW